MRKVFLSLRQAFYAAREILFTGGGAIRWLSLSVLFSFVLLDARFYKREFFQCCASRWTAYSIVLLFIIIDRLFEFVFVRSLGGNKPDIKRYFKSYARPALFMTLLDVIYLAFIHFFHKVISALGAISAKNTLSAAATTVMQTALFYLVIVVFVVIKWNIFMLLLHEGRNYFTKVKKAFIIFQENLGKYIVFGAVFLTGWLLVNLFDGLLARYFFGIEFKFGTPYGVLNTVGEIIAFNGMRVLILLPFYVFLYLSMMFFFYNVTEYPEREDMPVIFGFIVL